jgi:hypothetical protein
MPDTWHMAHCRCCKSLYLNPRPDRTSLPLAYANYYTHHPPTAEEPEGGGFVTALVNGYLESPRVSRRPFGLSQAAIAV